MRIMTAAESASGKLEHQLARIAAVKDQAAFAEIYAATRGKLFSTVLMIVKRSDLAEEIIQDTYVRIWSNAGSYRASSGSPMTWMIAIARNLAIDNVRKPNREVYAGESVLLEFRSELPSAAEAIEAAEDHRTAMVLQQKVFSALQALDPARRNLIIAAYINGESREQLSNRTGVPVNTIKTWIRRALLEVGAILRNSDGDKNVSAIARPALSR
ncbi:sigma-70 family RNA polymerase sigma factor [Bradyrhizobium sp.]|uniref:sigma-70 family RNA polymerase sigma factor n=1 Tax=Bradyrhizobium sp. TaxID=376 RepID=UPI0025BBE202|nr:sigma-70 family RNA polymerase sigma factor [Bradyrhizobium sp.]